MPRIKYRDYRPKAEAVRIIELADEILQEYASHGFDLTLRQLYYQMIAKDLFPDSWMNKAGVKNNIENYNRLKSIVSRAREAGMLDWDHITDRGRSVVARPHWLTGQQFLRNVSPQFHVDLWEGQPERVECFTPDVPVVTRDGLVPLGAIDVGDFVYTQSGRFRRVERRFSRPFAGMVLRVKLCGLPAFTVTREHPFWCRPYDDSRPGYKGSDRKFRAARWRKAEQLKRFDLLSLPKPVSGLDYPDLFDLEGGPRSRKIVNFSVTPAVQIMLGLYLAEGSVRGDGRTTQFTLGAHEAEAERLLKEFAVEWDLHTHAVDGAGTRVVYIYSKALADWLASNFGSGAFNKKIPSWLFTAAPRRYLPVLEWYFRGDGCFWDESRASIDATTRSQQLAQQVQLMLLWAGYCAAQDSVEDHGEPRYRISVGGASADALAKVWGVVIPAKGLGRSKRYNHIRQEASEVLFSVQSVLAVPYRGEVINLEVEEDHTYCVPVAAHNCWVEKDALSAVIERACRPFDVASFACKGYASASAMWDAAHNRFRRYFLDQSQDVVVIHLGDHDPSGVHMTQDVIERLRLFAASPGSVRPTILVERIALNMDQVRRYNPPPNPAKETDSRSASYKRQFGDTCWELDALEPRLIVRLVQAAIRNHLQEPNLFEDQKAFKQQELRRLIAMSRHWDELVRSLPAGAEASVELDDDDADVSDDEEE